MHRLQGTTAHNMKIVERLPSKGEGKQVDWVCECICGTRTVLDAYRITVGLKNQKHFFCRNSECDFNYFRKGNGFKNSKESIKRIFYTRWCGMNNRCGNPNSQDYPLYGGRGIRVCPRWRVFENFKEDMYEGFMPELSIDRIDTNGDYEPRNCRWATSEEQARNTRKNVYFDYKGKNYMQSDLAALLSKKSGIHPGTIISRYKRWGDWDMAIEKSVQKRIN